MSGDCVDLTWKAPQLEFKAVMWLTAITQNYGNYLYDCITLVMQLSVKVITLNT